MTIRTAHPGGALPARRRDALRRADRALRQGGGAGHRPPSSSPPSSPSATSATPRRAVALSGRAQRQGRQGRPARPAHAVLDRQVRLPRPRAARSWSSSTCSTARNTACSARSRLPVGGALPPALRHRPRRGAAVVRPPARDRAAARLHRTSGAEGRRALHEALLPDRQGRRRSHRASSARSSKSARRSRAPVLSRFIARLRPAARQATLTGSDDFVVDNNRINIADADVFERDPVNLIRLFHLAAEAQSRLPPGRHAAGDALAQADRRRGARRTRRPTGCSSTS